MLLEYGFKNYFSFREGAEISFKLDNNCPEHISRGEAYTPVLCVKGANAAGKTHVLRALGFLELFVTRSFARADGEHLPLKSHFDSNEPTAFYVEFMVGDHTYRYELEATETEILRETIHRTKSKRTKILERIKNEIVHMPAKQPALKSIVLRSNASVVSTLSQHKIDVLDEVADFFESIDSNVGFGGLYKERPIDEAGRLAHHSAELRKFIVDFLSRCDTGVSDIRILEVDEEDGSKGYKTLFVHQSNGKDHLVSYILESTGTVKLYKTLPTYFRALKHGGVMVNDEFDMQLHPDILPLIIDLFLDPTVNTGGGQLIFSTHDSGILDKLGRYRTYLVGKEENESFTYRLTSIPGDILRNDRPIRPAYEAGKVGGVPRL
ncbi:AAA family ATPase [Luteibacter sp.]|uniref:AAA family ATPase n=1 Tax=Luteibacter sp. TaxID=1886636 RepID=UPI003F805160